MPMARRTDEDSTAYGKELQRCKRHFVRGSKSPHFAVPSLATHACFLGTACLNIAPRTERFVY